jgi:hypothetical protein
VETTGGVFDLATFSPGRWMAVDGQDLLGSLSAQAGERFPGLGLGCGLGAGACRTHRWAEPQEVFVGPSCLTAARVTMAYWRELGLRAECTLTIEN